MCVLMSGHLQCTIRNVLTISIPQRLLASHLYSPASLLWMLISSRTSPSVRLPVLTSSQDTDGIGLPVTPQIRFQSSPSTAVMLLTVFMVLPAILKLTSL